MTAREPGTPTPTALTLHQASRVLEVGFADGSVFRLPFELLRVYSPSAEVQGHGPGQEVLQTGKREVGIVEIDAVGTMACSRAFRTVTIPAYFPGTICTSWARARRSCGASTRNVWPRPVSNATRPWQQRRVRPVAIHIDAGTRP
jgi:hypothetical protein